MKKKEKNFLENAVGDISGIQWKDLDHKKVYIAVGAIVLVLALIIGILVKAFGGSDEKRGNDPQNAVVETDDPEQISGEENPLELDAYDEINDLVFKYFYGKCMGDIDMLREVVDEITESEIQAIERKKDYVEAYKNIQCYTKKGMEEGSYVVFASYEMKIYDIETPAPGIEALYVCSDDNGNYYIFNGEASEELTNYVLELAAQEEIAAVIADVDDRYNQLVAEDEDLGKFAQTVLEAQQTTADADETAEAPEPEEETDNNAELKEPVSTKVTDGIRLREKASTDSGILATLTKGHSVKVYANYADGWSKISYNGMTGYCKTEYLESTEGVPTLSGEASTDTKDDEKESEETAETTAVNKKMKLTDTVRMRSEASTDSEVKKLLGKGEVVTVIEKYSNGWSKIQQDSLTGYCKTEYLADAD